MTKCIISVSLFWFVLVLPVAGFPAVPETLTLARNGKTDYRIVLPERATPVEETAARELKQHLDAVTGADFSVRNETEVDGSVPQILVGDSKRVGEFFPDLDIAAIPYDGIAILSTGRNLVLVGHPRRGTLYAVYTLLEDVVGIRWWTSTESSIPKRPTLEIPAQNVRYAPKAVYRKVSYHDSKKDPVFLTRMKGNSNWAEIPAEYGGYFRFLPGTVHSFAYFLPAKKYFGDHPEWYAEVDGRRLQNGQPCLTNGEMRRAFVQNVLESLRRTPDVDFLNIGQDDHQRYCRCAECSERAAGEESQAGPMLQFVNAVAEEVEKEFPRVKIVTLAYQYTRKPPKRVRPRNNVVIYLCAIECSFCEPIADGDENKPFRDDIVGWNRIADSLFIWDYTVNFSAYMLPHPNLRVLAPNIRFFIDHHAIGLNEQGDWFCSAGNFARLKQWILSRLIWNPDLDERALFDEFVEGYYGKEAAPFIKEYCKLIHDRVEASGIRLRCFSPTTQGWLDPKTVDEAVRLFGLALEATKDETFRNRIRREKLSVDLAALDTFFQRRRLARRSERPVTESPEAVFDDFMRHCEEFGVSAYGENITGRNFGPFMQAYRDRFQAAAAAVPDICADLPSENWIDLQECEFTIMNPGKLEFLIDDPAASNRRAVKMSGNHHEWGSRFYFDRSILDLEPCDRTDRSPAPSFRLYASVRCDARTEQGRAMTLGVYDKDKKKSIVIRPVAIADVVGPEYRWIDLGAIRLGTEQMFWPAPPQRPDEVDAIYIDRIVVVREQ